MLHMNIEYWLKLYLTKQLTPTDVLKLIQQYGNVRNVFTQNAKELSSFLNKNIGGQILHSWEDDTTYKNTMKWLMDQNNRHIITLDSSDYPELLASIPIPPILLFAEGNINLLKNRIFAIVGTRNPTPQGIDNAIHFAKEIGNNGYTIVSGLAEGIDTAAHKGALETNYSTIAVLGTGLNQCYPSGNRMLQDKIKASGLVISPFLLNDGPLPFHFPNRNRIIVGLSKACLVIESRINGGSMISANFAADIGREVFALPGSIHNINAQGCHKLIKQGAKLVENIQDIFEELPMKQAVQKTYKLTEQQSLIMRTMSHEPISIEQICNKSNMQISLVCDILLQLELSELITNSINGYYKKQS